MSLFWRIQLFGTLQAYQDHQQIHRFSTQKTGLLLAYLAYYAQRRHSREELIEMLWPEVEIGKGRDRFKQALASLRRQLEPLGASSPSLLVADRLQVGLQSQVVTTDVAEFLTALRNSRQAAALEEQKSFLCQATALYRGDLLSGMYADWVLLERARLTDMYVGALHQLITLHREAKEWDKAMDCAQRIIAEDTFNEEAHADLIRLYLAAGRPRDALRQYQTLERVLQEEMNETPSPALRALAQQMHEMGTLVRTAPALNARQAETSVEPSKSKQGSLSQAEGGHSRRFPISLTRFFGREKEMTSLQALLSLEASLLESPQIRLITVTGPGGTGKTRLALEAIRRLGDQFPGPIWFVPLADIIQASHIPSAISEALELRRSPTLDPMEQVIAFFTQGVADPKATKRFLLILDNYEHLVEEGAEIVLTLLKRVPSLICLVTSRQPLNLEGERELPLMPLPLPPASEPPDRLMDFPSVQLFVDRAQARRVDFALSTKNASLITAVCYRLEGIPLAIELAAAWARILTPGQILERLEHGLDLLVSRRKDIHPRHRSVWAAIEWSFQLLSPEIQRFFVSLCVFRGGWTIEAAEAICEEPLALAYLEQLQEYSLIVAEEYLGEMRFRMLEPIHQFCQQKSLSNKDTEALASKHCLFYLQFAEKMNNAKIRPEYENCRAALEGCLAAPANLDLSLRWIKALSLFWGGYGLWDEGRSYVARLLAFPQTDLFGEKRAAALHHGAVFALKQGDLTMARGFCQEMLAIWEEGDESAKKAQTLTIMAAISQYEGDYVGAYALYETCLAIYQETTQEPEIAGTLHNMGCVAQVQGNYEAARELQQQGLSLYRRLKRPGGIALCLGFLGDIARLQGDYPMARQMLEESVALFRGVMEPPRIAEMLVRLAATVLRQGEVTTTRELLAESIEILQGLGDQLNLVMALEVRASLAVANRQYELAARLYGATQAQREAIRIPVPLSEQDTLRLDHISLGAALGEQAFTSAFAAGSHLTWEQTLQLARYD